jgi:hypothetical protein
MQQYLTELLAALADARARRQITDAWLAGTIPAGHAMHLLVELGLIEASDIPAPREPWRDGFARLNHERSRF